MKCCAHLAALAFAAPAMAQATNATFLLMSSNAVTPATPSTTISVYAAWDQPAPAPNPLGYVLGAVGYDLVASGGEFTAANLVLGLNPPNRAGTLNGNRVDDAAIGQVHIPPLGIFGTKDNPVLLAEYTWTTTNFSFRTVDLSTENTSNFSLVPVSGGVSINMVLGGQFTPGAGSITVVPAPPALLALTLAALARRRRQPGETS